MNTRVRIIITIAALVVLAVLLRVTLFSGAADEAGVIASGTVEATEADLGFQAPGRIERIAVDEGDMVAGGADLASLDQAETVARKRAAEAQVAAARAGLSELERGFRSEEIAQARASVRAAQQRMSDALRDLERARRLLEGGAVSQQNLDHRQTAFDLAEAEHERAAEQLGLLESGPRRERITAQRAVVAQAEATVAQIEAALRNTTIRAPFGGVVTVRHREPGETVAAGAPVLTVMDPDDRWVRIYIREDELGGVNIGDAAVITADTYPDRAYDGTVVFIANEAEFTPRNVQTTEERVKLVYRVKVRISGDQFFELKPGLAADVRLQSHRR